MSALDVLLAIDAAASGQAQPRTSVRHRHLGPAPMVIVVYRMSGEAGAPLGVRFGHSTHDPTTLVAVEPRSRTIRFRDLLNPLARHLTNWFSNYELVDPESKPDRPVFKQAPQILVPNRATATFVGAVLGRSLRYLRSTDDYPVPDETILLGTHMSWLDQQSQTPGSCVLVAATDLLRRHWATGQSALEDEDLHVLLNWIDPPDGMTGAEAAEQAERARAIGSLPSAGPTPDPIWDRKLDPLLDTFNRTRAGDESLEIVESHGSAIEHLVKEALDHAWNATWRAHRLLRSLPEGDSVPTRWASDRRAWTRNVERVREGVAFFGTSDSARQGAWMLASFEEAQETLDIGEALDDPMVLAGLVANGEALFGEVIERDPTRTEQGPKRKVFRPTITLRLPFPAVIPVGQQLAWSADTKMVGEITSISGLNVELTIFKGMGRSANTARPLPELGTEVAFAQLTRESPPSLYPPQDVPWTHIGAESPRYNSEVPE